MTDLAYSTQGGDAASYDDAGVDAFAPANSPHNDFGRASAFDHAALDAAIEEADAPDAYEDPELDPFGEGDVEEVEHEGETYRVPKALKGALMRQGDYTRKTQALAAERKALESERATFAQESQARARFERDYAAHSSHDAALSRQLADFDNVDWQGLHAQDPQRAADLWRTYEVLHQERGALREAVSFAEQQREAIEAHQNAQAVDHCHAVLAREIEGWSPQLGVQLSQFGQAAFGFSPDELAAVTDPRMIKVLHLAMTAHEMRRQSSRARRIADSQRTAPAQTLKGHSGRFAPGADTTDFSAFERLADERMRRR